MVWKTEAVSSPRFGVAFVEDGVDDFLTHDEIDSVVVRRTRHIGDLLGCVEGRGMKVVAMGKQGLQCSEFIWNLLNVVIEIGGALCGKWLT